MGSAPETMGTSLWMIFLLLSGPFLNVQANTSASAFSCDDGCPQETFPVCGNDGEWYQNKCIATCAGVPIDSKGSACRESPMPFEDQKPGPQGAESNGLDNVRKVAKDVINAFRDEGLRYVGRIKLARELSPRPTGNVPVSQPEPEVGPDGSWHVDALRCTSSGDVYRGRMRIPRALAELEAAGPSPLAPWMKNQVTGSTTANSGKIVQESGSYQSSTKQQQQQQQPQNVFSKLKEYISSLLRSKRPGSSGGSGGGTMVAESGSIQFSQGDNSVFQQQAQPSGSSVDSYEEDLKLLQEMYAAAEASGAFNMYSTSSNSTATSPEGKHRRLLEIIGQDNRFGCDRGYPYTAIGQIQVVDNTGLYICTGTLIKPDKVLTAAHCVWNTKRNAFYFNLNFAPGRYREASGMVNPWGVVPWKSVTVFDAFKKNPATWDVAVVTLSKKLGSLTGYMGMAASCNSQVTLTVAGYPQDQAQGTCMANRCTVPYVDCNALTNIHTCDTIMGMSGSPLWDNKNRIRMIHVAGIQDRPENRATTVTQFLVNTISKW